MYIVHFKVVCYTFYVRHLLRGNSMENQKDTGSQQFTFRIPVQLKAELERIAELEFRSLSKQIISVLQKYVDEKSIEGKK